MRIDTLYFPQIDDNDLIATAQEQQRIILTRDRGLSQRKNAPVFFLGSEELPHQLQQLQRHFHLDDYRSLMRRCTLCNTPLQVIEKSSIVQRVPEKVRDRFTYFEYCPHCDRVYWQGDHFQRMTAYIERVLHC